MSTFLHLLYEHLVGCCWEPSRRLLLERTLQARGIVGNHWSWQDAR